eukprot:Colp12_sorted_trinity150504_noHs@20100
MESQEHQEAMPMMCISGCGFFGNPVFENMCSKCFKEAMKEKNKQVKVEQPLVEAKKVEPVIPAPTTAPVVIEKPAVVTPKTETLSAETTSAPAPKKVNRCATCNKKVGLTGFDCRCGGLFCGLHRYSDKHECNYDYKTTGKAELAKLNPAVVKDKIERL